MGDLPEKLVTPRLKTPRVSVPAAQWHCTETDGDLSRRESGVQIIGRTPVRLFDPGRTLLHYSDGRPG